MMSACPDQQPNSAEASPSPCGFRAVLFDWKGTLEPKQPKDVQPVSKEQLVQRAVGSVASELRAAGFQDDDFEAAHSVVSEGILSKHLLVSRGTVVSQALDRLSVSTRDPALAKRMQELYLETIRNPSGHRPIFPGAAELLRKLRERGIPVGLIRNSTLPRETMMNNLRDAGVADLFDAVVMSGEVGHEKPAAPIFLMAVSALGIQDIHEKEPRSIIFVGNETEADIKGAKAMGWSSCLLTSTEPHSDGHADYEVADMRQLDQVIFPSL